MKNLFFDRESHPLDNDAFVGLVNDCIANSEIGVSQKRLAWMQMAYTTGLSRWDRLHQYCSITAQWYAVQECYTNMSCGYHPYATGEPASALGALVGKIAIRWDGDWMCAVRHWDNVPLLSIIRSRPHWYWRGINPSPDVAEEWRIADADARRQHAEESNKRLFPLEPDWGGNKSSPSLFRKAGRK